MSIRQHRLEELYGPEVRQASTNGLTAPLRRVGTAVRSAVDYLWQGPVSLTPALRLEWRFVAIRWVGIVIVAPSLPLLKLPQESLHAAYFVLAVATVYNLALQVMLARSTALVSSGYLTTVIDALLDIAIVIVAGGFDSPLYFILYTVTISAAMRYGYGPVLAMASLFVVGDLVEGILVRHTFGAPFIFRSSFLFVNAILAGYLHEQTQEAENALEERLHQANALNKELEAFSYSVSHDLRAPLRSIEGFSLALLEDYVDVLDEEGQDYLRRVRAGSVRMAQLIDDLLNLSRVTRSEIERDVVNLSAMAREITAGLKESQPERQIRFVVARNIFANGDSQLLHLVLENLLTNAWKFTRDRSPAMIEFGETRQNGSRAYFVRDNGVGFDMTYADKLFGAFQRLHSFAEFQGNGIGLATVQRIVHRHGGKVWGEGKEGEGACFYFTL